LDFIKGGAFIDQLSDYKLIKNYFVRGVIRCSEVGEIVFFISAPRRDICLTELLLQPRASRLTTQRVAGGHEI
jgi:hypothetical protein